MPQRGAGPLTQDWDPVIIHKRPQKAADTKDPKLVNEARRLGAQIESTKKFDAGTNKSSSASNPAIYARKLAEETDVLAHDKVPTEVKVAIQKARMAAKLTQAQLAQKINEVRIRGHQNQIAGVLTSALRQPHHFGEADLNHKSLLGTVQHLRNMEYGGNEFV